jgi:hypothetical protein
LTQTLQPFDPLGRPPAILDKLTCDFNLRGLLHARELVLDDIKPSEAAQ